MRRALQLGKRDKIHYTIRPDGQVVLTRASTPADADPVLGKFLDFLACDISNHPDRLQAIDHSLVQHLQALTEGANIELDMPLSVGDE